MRLRIGVLTCLALIAAPLVAQVPAIIVGDGWEAFPKVQYQGGHASFSQPMFGVLVLTDSTLTLHPCGDGGRCGYIPTGGKVFKDSVLMRIRLADVRSVVASSQTVSPGVGRRVLWGSWANDRTQETVTLQVTTESSAEAPVFRTQLTQSATIDTKVRFRLERLGVQLRAPE